MKYLIFPLLFLLSLNVFSQQKNIDLIKSDSILRIVETHKNMDSTRVKLLLETSDEILYNDPKKAFKLVEEALIISNKIEWINGTIKVLSQQGKIYYYTRDYSSTLKVYLKALDLSNQIKNNSFIQARIHADIANIYAEMEQYNNALKNYNVLLSISKKLKIIKFQIIALANIGVLYTDMGLENKPQLIDKGINILEEALQLSNKENNIFFIASIKSNLGLAYRRKNEHSIALKHYYDAYDLAKQINNKHIEATVLNNISSINLILNQYDEAETNSNKSLKISKSINDIQRESDSWENLYRVYEYKNNNLEALIAYKNFIKLRDSVIKNENTEALVRMEMQFELKKQKTISDAKLLNEKLVKNNYAIGSSSILLLSLIGFLFYKRKKDKKEATFKIKVADTELKALKAQISPHFVFNSLDFIKRYIKDNNIDEASNYLTKFSTLIRKILQSSEKQEITIEEDLKLLKTYLEINQKRIPFSYQIKVSDNVDIANTNIPPLILQPFIENSIKHGISKLKEKGEIIIEINQKDQMLVCSVEDNGIGRKYSNLKPANNTKSLGMKITQNRVEIINQIKKSKGSVTIIDKEKGLKVEVKIPLELAI